MGAGPFDWRTLRLCEPEQARMLVRALGCGIPVLVAALLLGTLFHSILLPALLLIAYVIAVTVIAGRLVSSVKQTFDRLDPDNGGDASRPAWATAEAPGEALERRVELVLAGVDSFRAQYRRPLTLLGVVGAGVAVGLIGWGFVSLVTGVGSQSSATPPAS